MQRRSQSSSRNRQPPKPPSRAELWEQLDRELNEENAQHEKKVAVIREKMQALARRDPNDPNDVPEKDTYTPIDDLVEGADITGPAAAAKPALGLWWSDAEVTKWLQLALRIAAYFAVQEQETRDRVLEKDGIPYIQQHRDPRGAPISNHMAEAMFTLCRDEKHMTGGLRPQNNKKG